jgi:hypothetical protein
LFVTQYGASGWLQAALLAPSGGGGGGGAAAAALQALLGGAAGSTWPAEDAVLFAAAVALWAAFDGTRQVSCGRVRLRLLAGAPGTVCDGGRPPSFRRFRLATPCSSMKCILLFA